MQWYPAEQAVPADAGAARTTALAAVMAASPATIANLLRRPNPAVRTVTAHQPFNCSLSMEAVMRPAGITSADNVPKRGAEHSERFPGVLKASPNRTRQSLACSDQR